MKPQDAHQISGDAFRVPICNISSWPSGVAQSIRAFRGAAGRTRRRAPVTATLGSFEMRLVVLVVWIWRIVEDFESDGVKSWMGNCVVSG